MENLVLRKRLVEKNGCLPLFIRLKNVPAGFFLSVVFVKIVLTFLCRVPMEMTRQ